jgi:hypothetical protein
MLKNRFAVAAITVAALTLIPAAGATASGCDPLDTRSCILPFPSNFHTVAQKGSDTGLRLNFSASQFPKNIKGKSGFPPELNRNDGFSPGSALLTYVPGIDIAKTGAAPITDIAQYSKANAPIVVIDVKTGQRHPIWVELDTNADAISEAKGQLLMIHPAKNFLEGHTYVVALRNLKNGAGKTIAPGAAFASLRNGKPAAAVKGRRASYEKIFKALKKAKVSRSSLYLAWDFTIASERNLSERALSMRNRSFAALGDSNLADGKVAGKAPVYTIDKTEEYTVGQSARIARQITGRVTVPCFLTKGCATGGTMSYAKSKKGKFDSIPNQQGTMQALFICRIPRAAMTTPARPSLYGHGLLGSPDEIDAGNVDDMASEHNMMFCATPEIGMADEDVPNAIELLGDMSKFSSMADRLQQGLLNELILGRLMINPAGFAAADAFKGSSAQSAIDTSALYYDSNSQGAILGGALTALSPDFTRAVLGVGGMNYSLLLPRSVDFDTYELIFKPAYKSRLDRMLLLSAIQNLWDRGETNGYGQHVTSKPLPGTPKHNVLLHVALGDHQVAQVSAENEARTLGLVGRRPAYDAGRSFDKTPLWNIPSLTSANAGGSGLVIWDSGPCRIGSVFATCLEHDAFGSAGGTGNPVAPIGDLAPRLGRDPHSRPRSTPQARQQKSEFLKPAGKITEVCPANRACRSVGWDY